MHQVRRNIMERLQHEPPFRHARVRHDQSFVSDTCIAMEQQVEVDPARSPVGRAGAAENRCFDPEESLQQFVGG